MPSLNSGTTRTSCGLMSLSDGNSAAASKRTESRDRVRMAPPPPGGKEKTGYEDLHRTPSSAAGAASLACCLTGGIVVAPVSAATGSAVIVAHGDEHPYTVWPPSTTMAWPTTKEDASEQSQRTALAI